MSLYGNETTELVGHSSTSHVAIQETTVPIRVLPTIPSYFGHGLRNLNGTTAGRSYCVCTFNCLDWRFFNFNVAGLCTLLVECLVMGTPAVLHLYAGLSGQATTTAVAVVCGWMVLRTLYFFHRTRLLWSMPGLGRAWIVMPHCEGERYVNRFFDIGLTNVTQLDFLSVDDQHAIAGVLRASASGSVTVMLYSWRYGLRSWRMLFVALLWLVDGVLAVFFLRPSQAMLLPAEMLFIETVLMFFQLFSS